MGSEIQQEQNQVAAAFMKEHPIKTDINQIIINNEVNNTHVQSTKGALDIRGEYKQ